MKKKERERVHLVFDPRGFYKTEPIHWGPSIIGQLGAEFLRMEYLKKRIMAGLGVPSELLGDMSTNKSCVETNRRIQAVSVGCSVRGKDGC